MKKTIYKFFRINEYLYDTLISNQLYFSSIKQFNDPYDCHLSLPNIISFDEFKVYTETHFKDANTRNQLLKAWEIKPEELSTAIIGIYRELLNYYGICCFSKTKENLLMWSHYSDSHRGLSMGFDYNKMTTQFPQYDEVTYSDTPFAFDIKNINDSIAKTILRKSKNWEYEEEIRFLMERSKNVGFNQDALTEINFGSKCSKRNIISIQYLISKLGYKNCKFYHSQIDESNYSIHFKEVNFEKIKKEVFDELNEKRFSKQIDLKEFGIDLT